MDGRDAATIAGESEIISRARAVAEVLRTGTKRIEADREMPSDLLKALHDARLFRLLIPRSLGGEETDLGTLARVAEIIAAADASAAWCVGQGAGCAMSAAYVKPDVARRFFGSPDAVLAWGAGAAGKAVPVDGGYRITGKWDFASGSRHATMLGAHCKVAKEDGSPVLLANGRQAELTGLLPKAKAHIRDTWQVVGLKGTGSDSYDLDNLFIPADDVFIRDESYAIYETGTLFRFPAMNAYAGAFGGVMLGIARGTLADLKALAMTKTPRGASSSLRDNPVFQTELAVLEARFRAARVLHLTTLDEMWRAVDGGAPLTLELRVNARLAATHAINEGHEIVSKAYRAAGQTAVFETNPFEQRLRDANAAAQQVQGRPGHYTTVGRHLLGLAPDTMMFL